MEYFERRVEMRSQRPHAAATGMTLTRSLTPSPPPSRAVEALKQPVDPESPPRLIPNPATLQPARSGSPRRLGPARQKLSAGVSGSQSRSGTLASSGPPVSQRPPPSSLEIHEVEEIPRMPPSPSQAQAAVDPALPAAAVSRPSKASRMDSAKGLGVRSCRSPGELPLPPQGSISPTKVHGMLDSAAGGTPLGFGTSSQARWPRGSYGSGAMLPPTGSVAPQSMQFPSFAPQGLDRLAVFRRAIRNVPADVPAADCRSVALYALTAPSAFIASFANAPMSPHWLANAWRCWLNSASRFDESEMDELEKAASGGRGPVPKRGPLLS
eukprot:s6645_g2.t1